MPASARRLKRGTGEAQPRSAREHVRVGSRGAVKRSRGVRWRSKVKLFGWPLCEIALGPNVAKGERRGHARAVLALGNIADGVIAVGGISRGIVSIGGISCGLCSLGGVSLGLLAAMGGVAIAPLALGGVAAGVLASGGAGWNRHGRLRPATSLKAFLPHAIKCRIRRMAGYRLADSQK
jgi:hypothetical protein